MPKSPSMAKRGRLNALQRHRTPDDPAVIDARRELAAERLAEHIDRVVSTAPALTAEQVDRLRSLLPAAPPGSARQPQAATSRRTEREGPPGPARPPRNTGGNRIAEADEAAELGKAS